jgi:hypothetical protein
MSEKNLTELYSSVAIVFDLLDYSKLDWIKVGLASSNTCGISTTWKALPCISFGSALAHADLVPSMA